MLATYLLYLCSPILYFLWGTYAPGTRSISGASIPDVPRPVTTATLFLPAEVTTITETATLFGCSAHKSRSADDLVTVPSVLHPTQQMSWIQAAPTAATETTAHQSTPTFLNRLFGNLRDVLIWTFYAYTAAMSCMVILLLLHRLLSILICWGLIRLMPGSVRTPPPSQGRVMETFGAYLAHIITRHTNQTPSHPSAPVAQYNCRCTSENAQAFQALSALEDELREQANRIVALIQLVTHMNNNSTSNASGIVGQVSSILTAAQTNAQNNITTRLSRFQRDLETRLNGILANVATRSDLQVLSFRAGPDATARDIGDLQREVETLRRSQRDDQRAMRDAVSQLNLDVLTGLSTIRHAGQDMTQALTEMQRISTEIQTGTAVISREPSAELVAPAGSLPASPVLDHTATSPGQHSEKVDIQEQGDQARPSTASDVDSDATSEVEAEAATSPVDEAESSPRRQPARQPVRERGNRKPVSRRRGGYSSTYSQSVRPDIGQIGHSPTTSQLPLPEFNPHATVILPVAPAQAPAEAPALEPEPASTSPSALEADRSSLPIPAPSSIPIQSFEPEAVVNPCSRPLSPVEGYEISRTSVGDIAMEDEPACEEPPKTHAENTPPNAQNNYFNPGLYDRTDQGQGPYYDQQQGLWPLASEIPSLRDIDLPSALPADFESNEFNAFDELPDAPAADYIVNDLDTLIGRLEALGTQSTDDATLPDWPETQHAFPQATFVVSDEGASGAQHQIDEMNIDPDLPMFPSFQPDVEVTPLDLPTEGHSFPQQDQTEERPSVEMGDLPDVSTVVEVSAQVAKRDGSSSTDTTIIKTVPLGSPSISQQPNPFASASALARFKRRVNMEPDDVQRLVNFNASHPTQHQAFTSQVTDFTKAVSPGLATTTNESSAQHTAEIGETQLPYVVRIVPPFSTVQTVAPERGSLVDPTNTSPLQQRLPFQSASAPFASPIITEAAASGDNATSEARTPRDALRSQELARRKLEREAAEAHKRELAAKRAQRAPIDWDAAVPPVARTRPSTNTTEALAQDTAIVKQFSGRSTSPEALPHQVSGSISVSGAGSNLSGAIAVPETGLPLASQTQQTLQPHGSVSSPRTSDSIIGKRKNQSQNPEQTSTQPSASQPGQEAQNSTQKQAETTARSARRKRQRSPDDSVEPQNPQAARTGHSEDDMPDIEWQMGPLTYDASESEQPESRPPPGCSVFETGSKKQRTRGVYTGEKPMTQEEIDFFNDESTICHDPPSEAMQAEVDRMNAELAAEKAAAKKAARKAAKAAEKAFVQAEVEAEASVADAAFWTSLGEGHRRGGATGVQGGEEEMHEDGEKEMDNVKCRDEQDNEKMANNEDDDDDDDDDDLYSMPPQRSKQ